MRDPPEPPVAGRAGSGRSRRGVLPLNALLILSTLLPAAILGAAGTYDRHQTLMGAERDLLSTLDALRGHAESTLQFQTLALGAVAERLQGLSRAEVLAEADSHHAHLRALRMHAAQAIGLVVFDADGRPVADAERAVPPPGIDVSDRDYFRWHRDNPGPEPFIAGAFRSRADGTPIFFVTLRWSGSDGTFRGVLAAGVRQSAFLEHWDSVVWDPRALVSLVRDDGVILARRPALDPDHSNLLSPQAPLAHAIKAGADRVVHRGVSPLDGADRLFAYRRIERFGVNITHGVAVEAALAPWRGRLPIYVLLTTVMAVALASLALLAKRSLRSEQDLNASLEDRVRQRTAEIRLGEDRVRFLAREVDHRAKNALAVVQATLRLTPRADAHSYARAVEGRVAALARAQTLLAEDRWQGASLSSLLRTELAAFVSDEHDAIGARAELKGPPVVLPPVMTQPVAMAVHELATNAVKHGALSAPGGRVTIVWSAPGPLGETGPVLRLRWAESGGPALADGPRRRGFGSRVLDSVVRGQLGGQLRMQFKEPGLVCEIEVPIRTGPEAPASNIGF